MSRLLDLVCSNDHNAVAAHINSGVAIDRAEQTNWFFDYYTPLHYAVYYRNPAMIRLLAGANFVITLKDTNNLTPIELAFEKSLWDSLTAFCHINSDTHDAAGYRNVILKLIQSRQHYDLARQLLDRVTPTITGQFAIDIVREAIATGDADLISHVVCSRKIEITAEHTNGFVTLSVRGDRNAVINLLQRGALPPADYIDLNANANNWTWVNIFIEHFPPDLITSYQTRINNLLSIAINQEPIGDQPLEKLVFLFRTRALPELSQELTARKYQLAIRLLENIRTPITEKRATDIVLGAMNSQVPNLIDRVLRAENIDFRDANHDAAFVSAYQSGSRERVLGLLQRGAKPPTSLITEIANANRWDWVRAFIENLSDQLKHLPMYQDLLNALIMIAINQVDDGTPIDPAAPVQNRTEEIIFLLNQGATRTQALSVHFAGVRWNHLINTALAQREGANTDYKACALLAFRQQWELLREFANHPVDVNDAAEYGVAMVIAAYHGQLELAQMLLANGARLLSTCGIHATTAVYGAIKHWQVAPGFLRELVRRDASLVNQVISQHPQALFPIQFAFDCPDTEVLKFLLDNGATPFPNANNELLKAARLNKWDWVHDFFEWSAAHIQDPSVPNLLGELLHIATVQKAADEVKWLLRLDAPKHYEKDGLTPIQRATDLGAWDVISVYTNFPTGADDNCRYGHAFLRLIQVGRIPDALELLMKGASTACVTTAGNAVMINDQDDNEIRSFPANEIGYSALHYAVLKCEVYPRLLTALLERDPNINLPSSDGTTPLQLALDNGKAVAVKQLMQARPDIRDVDLNRLIVLAKRGSVEDWAVIIAFIQNDDLVGDAKFAIYHGVLKEAILKNNKEVVPLLRDRLVQRLAGVQDPLHIVYAAKLKRWGIVRLMSERMTAHAHHTARDYLLAAFWAIVAGDENELAHQLLDLSNDPTGRLNANELKITGFEQKQVGYNALMFAIDAEQPNHEFTRDYWQSPHYAGTTAEMGERYIKAAFAAKNKIAVAYFSKEGIPVDLQTLMHASTHQNWDCVVAYLQEAIKHRDCTDIFTALFVESHRVNNAIDQRFLQQMMVHREVQPQVERNLQQNHKMLQACVAAIVLFNVLFASELLDATQLIACLCIPMTIMWIVLSTQHPDNKAVKAIQTGFSYASEKITALTIWSKDSVIALSNAVYNRGAPTPPVQADAQNDAVPGPAAPVVDEAFDIPDGDRGELVADFLMQ